MFQNKYKPSSLLKIFFADVVCFIFVAIFSIGFCYSYFSDGIDVGGKTTTAVVSVDYRTNYSQAATSISVIYGNISRLNAGEDEATIITTGNITTENVTIIPGDKLTIKGYAVNTSDVEVYVLAKLEVVCNNGTADETEIVWYNISNGNKLSLGGNGVHTVGASSLLADGKINSSSGKSYFQELALEYTFDGNKYTNSHTIKSLTLTLQVHQKEYLELAEDYSNYSKYDTDGDGLINDYEISSIYATHYMTGNLLTA